MVPKPLEEITKTIENYDVLSKNCTPASLPVAYIDIQFHDDICQDDSEHMQLKCSKLPFPFSASSVVTAPIREAQILYDGEIGSKKFVELVLEYSKTNDYVFVPGDSVGILVSNSKEDVKTVLERLQENDHKPDVICDIAIKKDTTKKNARFPSHIPQEMVTPRSILRDCFDLRSVPMKLFLRSLAEYTTDKDEKNLLMLLSSKEGSKLYNKLILEKTKSFLDVLDLCSSCYPPLSLLIEHLPRLKPRPYSIANSPLSNPGQIKLILSVLNENPGVGTAYLTEKVHNFLENPEKPEEISFYFRQTNQFYFQSEKDSILIGIGCGVSPFLGYLQHKDELMKQNHTKLGSTWLFVGSTCQDSAVHRDELLDYQIRGVLEHLYESFSRDPDPDCADFKHVQDRMRANAEDFVQQLTKKETVLYVCADGTKISKSIEDCIKECLVKVLECSDEEATLLIKVMRSSGKYKEDIWV